MGYDVTGVAPGEGPGMGPPAPGLSNNSAQGSGFPLGPALIAGGAVVSGIANYFSAQSTNDANSAEAAANRAFAAQEAETSRQYDQAKTMWQATHGYQNAVADMKAAGLNPAMMYAGKGGSESGTGGGGSAASAPGNPVHTNALGAGLGSAIQAASILNDFRTADAQIAAQQAQAFNATANARLAASNARLTDEETSQLADRRDSNRASAIRDAGDAAWEDSNRTARMLTSKAGVGAAVINSAKSADGLLQRLIGAGTWNKENPGSYGTLNGEVFDKKTGEILMGPRKPTFNFKTGRLE